MRYRSVLLAAAASILTGVLVVQAQVPGVNSTLATVFTLAYDNSTMKSTYSASVGFVPAASATDICTISGSATKNVRVRRVTLTGVGDAVQNRAIAFNKRSTANSGGTSTTPTVVPYDSAFSAGTAVVRAYTANPTTGTLVGMVADPLVLFGNLTTGPATTYEAKFGELGSPIVLRGVAQSLAVNLNGATVTTPVVTCTIEWTEE